MEKTYFQSQLATPHVDWEYQRDEEIKALTLRGGQLSDRLGLLTDAFLDDTIEKQLFGERKAALLHGRKGLEEKTAELRQTG